MAETNKKSKKEKKHPTPPDTDITKILLKLIEVQREKEAEYGAAYKRHGNIMAALFPNGITLQTAEDFNFFAIYDLLVVKMNRMASSLVDGEVHMDSLGDISVYSAMGAAIAQEFEDTHPKFTHTSKKESESK